MPRHTMKLRETARQMYLTGEITSVAEIARRLRIKPHTLGRWRRGEDWDGLRLKIDRRAAEQLVEKLASERVSLNEKHYKLWGVVVGRLFETLRRERLDPEQIRSLDKVAGILERAQRGQRLARGLSLDGQTEEQLRAEAEAETRRLVDAIIEVLKTEIADEALRDRLAEAIRGSLPHDLTEEED